MIGKILSHYRIDSLVGAGGMGVVYRAYDLKLHRTIAVKILTSEPDDDSRERLLDEARAASALNHPHICTVHEVDEAGDQAFIVMEYVEGAPLSKSIRADGLPIETVLKVGQQLADALGHAHARGLVHRDLKSSNVVVTPDGRAKVLDFGLARRRTQADLETLTQSRTTVEGEPLAGTLAYMAPELLRGFQADTRSDLWALGVILYEMASGRRPFEGRTPFELTAHILQSSPDRVPQIPAQLWRVILRCLSKEPRQRYVRAEDLRADLDAIESGPPPRRVYWLAIAAAAVLALIAWTMRGALPIFQAQPATPDAAQVARPKGMRKAVAVLGFRNLSGRAEAAWLSTAFAEMFATELAAGERLRTIAAENVARARIDLSLADAESFGKETLARIHRNLGCEYVVLGSYVSLSAEAGGGLRLDVQLQDARAGETVASINEAGTEADLLTLVSRAGARLRARLNVGQISETEAGVARAALPATREAARLYSEGVAKLRLFDAAGARELLEQAIAADPANALAHSALAAAWSGLGYDAKAAEEARLAFERTGSLAREDRLSIEGRYREIARDWTNATKTYAALWTFFPDSIDYGLRLASVQIGGGQTKEALVTIDALRALPAPMRDDPRIDLTEALAARALGNAKQERAASARAAENANAQGARLLVAEARLSEGSALRTLGELDNAVAAWEGAGRIYRDAGNRLGAARAVNNIAIVLLQRSELAAAKTKLEEARATFHDIGYQVGIAATASNLGIVLSNEGDVPGAKKMFEDARGAYREIGDRRGQTRALNNLANPLYRQGELAAAKKTLEEALTIGRELDDRQSVGYSLIGLGDAMFEEDRLADARARYDEALGIMRQAENKQMEAVGRLALAAVSLEEGRAGDAAMIARETASLFHAQKDPYEALAHALVARAQLSAGDVAGARQALTSALEIGSQSHDPAIRLALALTAGRVDTMAGKYGEARARLEAAVADAQKIHHARYRLEGLLALGELQVASGDLASGRSRLATLQKEAEAKGFLLIGRKAAAARRR